MSMKSLEELNREFMAEESAVTKTPESNEAQFEIPGLSKETESAEVREEYKKRSLLGGLMSILFGLALLLVLTTALTSSRYSFFTVLTGSMQNEIPKGSLILVDKTELQELATGDNITFMRDRRNAVTHKIVEIFDDYLESGSRGFQTKGTNNTNPDREIVIEENIIGKVVFVIPRVGTALSWLGDNIHIILIMLGVLVVITLTMHSLKSKGGNRKKQIRDEN